MKQSQIDEVVIAMKQLTLTLDEIHYEYSKDVYTDHNFLKKEKERDLEKKSRDKIDIKTIEQSIQINHESSSNE